MPADDFGAVATRIAMQIRSGSQGFISMKKEALREAFGVGRMTVGLSDQIVQALWDERIFIHPNPAECANTLRVYDHTHPIGKAAHAVVAPESATDAPLHALARLHERAKAGEELRSDDVPWLEAFNILLQLAVGKEPDDWEDLRDDRHGSMLAQELAQSLGLDPTVVSARWFINLAAAVNSGRPRRRTPQAGEMVGSPAALPAAEALATLLERRDTQIRTLHRESLELAAQTVLLGEGVPVNNVELGVLGMRRRIEENR